MTERTEDTTGESPEESTGRWLGFERRPLLKALGVGATLSLGGRMAAASEHDTDDGNETDDDGHFVEDLVDPTFGYPLAAEETDDLDLEHVVELYTEEGEGAHEGFPQGPPSGGNGEADGFPFEFAFDPVGIHVEPDDLVHFWSTAGEHTVTAFHEKYSNPELDIPTRIPDDAPEFTSPPLVDGESWVYQFSTKGVYDVLCLPHLFFGMVMRVVVFDPDEDDIEDETFAAPTEGELPPNVEPVLTAEELDPENIVHEGTVAWSDLTLESEESSAEMQMPGGSGESLTAVLAGRRDEVETEASGCAHFTPADDSLEWELVLEDIEEVTQAHVHEGGRGEQGPVVAPMLAYTGGVDGSGEGEPQSADPDDPIIESGVVDDADLVADILEDPSGYYVNVHTTENPAGEIRGQIRGREDDDSADEESAETGTDDEGSNSY